VSGLSPLLPDSIDADQRALYDAVLASPRAQGPGRALLVRDDGSLTGPFDPWLRSPIIGALLERVGMALRTDTQLPDKARETAILVVARAWNADFEWWIHSMLAAGAGVPAEVIDAIAYKRGVVSDDPILSAAHDVAFELVYNRALSPETCARATETLGERGIVEVVINVGFYQLVSGTLESFHPPGPSININVVGPPKLDDAERSV
jgi:4-carboxymuconolactone decarboxylase